MYENLRALREDRDINQTTMAKNLKVHQTTYSDYELGKLNIPTDVLVKLALFFNTSVDYILGLTDEMKPYPRKK
ncbi:MAG: helix-turn-helix transcriptional regulator [Oscillospiraceae bacterium]|nr:helix-turn-helix transcriptional regulator [Oscillospiraceae bacterium]